MWKFAMLLLAVPLYADVMTFNDTGKYFVGTGAFGLIPSDVFDFDLSLPQGAKITSALLQVKVAYGLLFHTVWDEATRMEVSGPMPDFALSLNGWSEHFFGLGNVYTDLHWYGFQFDADGVAALNSSVGSTVHIIGTLDIPPNPAQYFLFDGSGQSRLTLEYDGAAAQRVSSLQFDPVPEPAAWLLMAPLVLPVLRMWKRLG